MMSIAQTFERQGRFAEAKEVYGQILAKQPNSEEVRRRLANLEAEQGGNQPSEDKSLAAKTAPASAPAQPRQVPASPDEARLSRLDQRSTNSGPSASAPQTAADSSASSTTVLANAAVDSTDSHEQFLTPIVRSSVGVHRSENKSQSLAGSIPQSGLARSEELRPFFGMPHKQLMAELQERRETLVPHLVQVVADESFDLKDRSLAAFLLGELGPEAVEILPSLREAMRTCQSAVLRIDIAQAVLLIQPADTEAIHTLLESLRAPDDNIKWYAAFALRTSASAQTKFVVDALIETLDSDNDRLRRMVILTLGEFGPAAAKAVPELEAALTSPDPKTRVVAEAALATISPVRPRESSDAPDPVLE
jgi:hypothetical protein